MLYIFPCKYNYRPDHCMYGEMCQTAKKDGVKIVHGCRGVYHNEKMPTFKAIYSSIKQYNFQENIKQHLLKVKKILLMFFKFNCVSFRSCKKDLKTPKQLIVVKIQIFSCKR